MGAIRSRGHRFGAAIESAVANPLVAYGAVVLVQVRVIWKYWEYKDLNAGDTSAYFLDAAGWAHGLHENITFSPLYDVFFGTILAATRNVYAAAMIHRVAIVLIATVLVLALMRALLGSALGLLLALWWAIVPTNFNALYEVHLFGVVPILIAALIAARFPGRTGRGVALAVLLGETILLRNELLLATLILAAAVVVHEIRTRGSSRASRGYLLSYGVPLAVVFVLAGGAYWRSHVQGPDVTRVLRAKSELALCTAYAANYAQRHPSGFAGNPFVDCQPLMQQVFGRPLPSVAQAAKANLNAVVSFAGWNLREVPSAIALGLFGASPGGDNPGYTAVNLRNRVAAVLSILVGIVVIAGSLMLVRDWEFWRRWLARRHWALIVLGSIVIGNVLVVIGEERPWTEYTFALTVGALFVIGLCLSALLRRLVSMRVLAVLAAGATIALAVAIPPFYHPGPRPVRDGIQRLKVVRDTLDAPGAVMVAPGLGQSMCFYLARSFEHYCKAQVWPVLRRQVSKSRSVETVLANTKASVIYADTTLVSDPLLRRFFADPRKYGWRQIAGGIGSDGPWRILVTATRP